MSLSIQSRPVALIAREPSTTSWSGIARHSNRTASVSAAPPATTANQSNVVQPVSVVATPSPAASEPAAVESNPVLSRNPSSFPAIEKAYSARQLRLQAELQRQQSWQSTLPESVSEVLQQTDPVIATIAAAASAIAAENEVHLTHQPLAVETAPARPVTSPVLQSSNQRRALLQQQLQQAQPPPQPLPMQPIEPLQPSNEQRVEVPEQHKAVPVRSIPLPLPIARRSTSNERLRSQSARTTASPVPIRRWPASKAAAAVMAERRSTSAQSASSRHTSPRLTAPRQSIFTRPSPRRSAFQGKPVTDPVEIRTSNNARSIVQHALQSAFQHESPRLRTSLPGRDAHGIFDDGDFFVGEQATQAHLSELQEQQRLKELVNHEVDEIFGHRPQYNTMAVPPIELDRVLPASPRRPHSVERRSAGFKLGASSARTAAPVISPRLAEPSSSRSETATLLANGWSARAARWKAELAQLHAQEAQLDRGVLHDHASPNQDQVEVDMSSPRSLAGSMPQSARHQTMISPRRQSTEQSTSLPLSQALGSPRSQLASPRLLSPRTTAPVSARQSLGQTALNQQSLAAHDHIPLRLTAASLVLMRLMARRALRHWQYRAELESEWAQRFGRSLSCWGTKLVRAACARSFRPRAVFEAEGKYEMVDQYRRHRLKVVAVLKWIKFMSASQHD